ncbi:hypothetical protein BO063_004431 [Shigella flexneri]|nr:hypothetical protein [Shigella flexneri]
MLVKDMIKAIANKEIKVQDLEEKYGFSDRTIQDRIKKLGFKWDAKEAKYDFVGTDESVYDLSIDEVFKKISRKNKSETTRKNTAKKEVEKASKELASTVQVTHETHSKKDSNNDIDNIDMLLAGKKAKKVYRGFYFDKDVVSVIDSVDSGIKSELINECLRKVFKEKGLL